MKQLMKLLLEICKKYTPISCAEKVIKLPEWSGLFYILMFLPVEYDKFIIMNKMIALILA